MINIKIKPILFNTEMVRAIQDNRKTMTRRVVKPQPWCDSPKDCGCTLWNHGKVDTACPTHCISTPDKPYQPGDLLYVRETFFEHRGHFYYKADRRHEALAKLGISFKWRPSIHMPREAARLFLRVTGVRAERLQDITEDGVMAEGAKDPYDYQAPAWYDQHDLTGNYMIDAFAGLWDSTIKPADLPLYSWEANPWVWVIEFERCEQPEGWLQNQ